MLSGDSLLAAPGADPDTRHVAGTGGSPGAFSLVAGTAILMLLLALTASRGAVNVVLVLLAMWALSGPARAIQAMALAVIVKFANPALVDLGTESGPLLWVVLLCAGLRVLPTLRTDDARALAFVWAFAAVAAALSALTSSQAAISFMKAAVFVWVISTLFVAFRAVTKAELTRLATWFSTLGVMTTGLSALTLLDPSVAYLLNGTGLQGIFSHPQTLAIVAAPLAAFGLATAVLGSRGLNPLAIGLTAMFWIVLVLTEARTGVFAATVGAAAGFAMHLWHGGRDRLPASRARVVGIAALSVVALAVTVVNNDGLTRDIEGFLLKRSGESALNSAFYLSRGAGIASQWQNFLEKPHTGHGFGIYAKGAGTLEVVEFAGIPISAPVEKGFLPTAVLEETGLLGGGLFALMLLQLTQLAWRSGDARWFAVFVACVATNAGEASMLSPGGPGLLLWCFIGLALAMRRIAPAWVPLPAGPGVQAARPADFPNVMR